MSTSHCCNNCQLSQLQYFVVKKPVNLRLQGTTLGVVVKQAFLEYSSTYNVPRPLVRMVFNGTINGDLHTLVFLFF